MAFKIFSGRGNGGVSLKILFSIKLIKPKKGLPKSTFPELWKLTKVLQQSRECLFKKS